MRKLNEQQIMDLFLFGGVAITANIVLVLGIVTQSNQIATLFAGLWCGILSGAFLGRFMGGLDA